MGSFLTQSEAREMERLAARLSARTDRASGWDTADPPEPERAEIRERAAMVRAESMAARAAKGPARGGPGYVSPARKASKAAKEAAIREALAALIAGGVKVTAAEVARRAGLEASTVSFVARRLKREGVWPR